MFRQTTRDFCVNQQFRKDYWVRGVRNLSTLEQAEGLRALRVLLVQPRAEVSLKVKGSLGEATLQEAVYNPILDLLADHKPKSLGQMEQAFREGGIAIGLAQIQQAVMVLSATGAISAVQSDTDTAKAKLSCERINQHLIMKARASGELNYLASPVTGGGVSVSRFNQLFLLAKQRGHTQPADCAQFVWTILADQGQLLFKDGKTLDTAEENIAELTAQACAFEDKQLPILRALQVA
jgi:hypothetical protein